MTRHYLLPALLFSLAACGASQSSTPTTPKADMEEESSDDLGESLDATDDEEWEDEEESDVELDDSDEELDSDEDTDEVGDEDEDVLEEDDFDDSDE